MFGRIKRDKLDIVFSKLIREANEYICAKCGRDFSGENKAKLHCSHFYSRSHKVTRWHPMNVAPHCIGCHDFLGRNPIDFNHWITGYLGEENLASLISLRNMKYKITKAEKKLIHEHYKAEYARVLALRKEGVIGPIVVAAYFDTVM